MILAAIWAGAHFHIELAGSQKPKRKGLTIDGDHSNILGAHGRSVPKSPFEGIGLKSKSTRLWRDEVKSLVVENAWEILCGSIIQEVEISCATHSTLKNLFVICQVSGATKFKWISFFT